MIAAIIAVALYLLTYPLTWFANKFIVGDALRRPIWFDAKSQAILFVVKQVMFYVSIGLICWQFSWIYALVAFIVAFAFNKVTFKNYYEKELFYIYEGYCERMQEMKEFKDLDDEERRSRAMKIAQNTILRNMKGTSY